MERHLAQLNVARMRAPLDDPVMAGFVEQLDWINAVADGSPGFVWRLQDDGGDATGVRAFDDPAMLVNMSVWTSIETLYAYVYRSDHRGPMRDRRAWFEPMDGPHAVLWWIAAGHRPGVEEARARLEHLAAHGPTPRAFTFAHPFDAEGRPAQRPSRSGDGCRR